MYFYKTFGDVFAYRTSGEYHYTRNTRWFHDCILLKDIGAEYVHAGSVVNTIQVVADGRIWMSIDPHGMVYEFVDVVMRVPTFDQMITDIRNNMRGADIYSIIAFDTHRELEDYYGVVFGDAITRKFVSKTTCKILHVVCSSRNKIVYAFKRAISDPSYQMCRNRLMREASELPNNFIVAC